MKVLFLDIDGVLNWEHTPDRIGRYIGLCPERIARLNRIVAAVPDLKIVISSTWRHSFSTGAYRNFEELVALLKSRGVSADIIGPTPKRYSYVPRGGEIREWLDENREPIEAMVVLDDDTSGMQAQTYDPRVPDASGIDLRPVHVVTSWDGEDGREGGLQDSDVELAIRILNGYRLPVSNPVGESGAGCG